MIIVAAASPSERSTSATQRWSIVHAPEVCAPLGEGCLGCYLIARAPALRDHEGWYAEILRPNAERDCGEFLLNANGADPNQKFHEPENLHEYNRSAGEQRRRRHGQLLSESLQCNRVPPR